MSQKSQVVIQDFSAGAVDIFLRFLYTGRFQGSASNLLEVAALADYYQVEVLHAAGSGGPDTHHSLGSLCLGRPFPPHGRLASRGT